MRTAATDTPLTFGAAAAANRTLACEAVRVCKPNEHSELLNELVTAESKAASNGFSRMFSLIGQSTSNQTSLNVSPAGWASVFVRVVDDQRGAIVPAPLDLTSTDFQFLFLSSKLEKHVQGSQDAPGAQR